MHRRSAISALLMLLVGPLTLAGCSKKETTSTQGTQPEKAAPAEAAAAPAELNLLIFSEYIDEGIVSDFEKKNSIRLRITTYESSEEMESKLSYGGADNQYDLVVAASQVIPRLAQRNIIQPIDHAKIPNLKNLDPRFSGKAFDDGNKYGVPYQWGTVGLMYDKKKLPSFEPSWSAVFEPKKMPKTFVLLDEMRDMLGAVLKYKGYSSNTAKPEEVREAGRILQEAKLSAKCLGFKGGVGAVQDVKAGTVDVAVVWNGDALKEVLEDKENRLAYAVPKEGSIMWIDALMITRRAPQPDLAHKFVNYLLEPEVGAKLSVFTRYATPNAAAQQHIPPEDRKNPAIYPPDNVMERLEYHRDLGEALKMFDEVWTTVKSR